MCRKVPTKLAKLSREDFASLICACRNCLILGGLATCSCLTLDKFEKLTGMTKSRLLAWYKGYDKQFVKEYVKGKR